MTIPPKVLYTQKLELALSYLHMSELTAADAAHILPVADPLTRMAKRLTNDTVNAYRQVASNLHITEQTREKMRQRRKERFVLPAFIEEVSNCEPEWWDALARLTEMYKQRVINAADIMAAIEQQ